MYRHMKQNKLIIDNHLGFRKHLFIVDQVAMLTDFIIKAFNKKKHTDMLLLALKRLLIPFGIRYLYTNQLRFPSLTDKYYLFLSLQKKILSSNK